ncbi:MAG: DNA double-strand break repair nuclease NurA [Haloferacaceae archaeon]
MTLDPVHVEGIAQLAGALARNVDDSDHADLARTVWNEWLDPLRDDDGRVVVAPVGERRLRSVPIDEVALVDDPFPTTHGLDAGTINPTTFKNGLVLDVAQAAMASVPSDLELHRSRTLVLTAHSNDRTLSLDSEWRQWDEGYSKYVTIQAPRVSRYAEGVVHALSLYLAESTHALEHADAVSDLLLLDGPLYPKELLNWRDRDAELNDLVTGAKPRSIVENYVRLVERFLDRDVALAGFVKNPASNLITRTVDARGVDAPWADDTAMFARLLERHADGERRTDALTFTSWFRSRGGADRTLAADSDALGVDRGHPAESYEVTFFVVYDPREDLCYRVEAPYGVTRDDDVRERLTKQVLRDVAATRGPPEAVEKADSLARVGREEKAALRRKFERRLDSEFVRTYDDVRWGGED